MRPTKLSVALGREALAARTESANGWLQGTPPGRTVRRVIDGLIDIELADRSMSLAAKIFTSVLPLIIAASIFSDWDLATHAIEEQLGIDSTDLSAWTSEYDATDPTFAAFGVLGLLLVAISGTSFTRTLARIYAKIWNVPPISARDAWRWLVVLLLVAASAALIGVIRQVSGPHFVGRSLAILGELAVWAVVWTVCPYLLTRGALSGRVLWATGMLTASGLTVVRAAGRIALPKLTATAETKFGPLGVVFTSISWLFALSMVIVGAATITKALALDESYLGRYLRGPSAGA
ncbi:hypothetical protein [Rhodococcus aetherivorans]|uniref:hypothetical protein n=1 Tax=Rhodococcus aetherivorans TaxID=191292 RepID=UPI0024202BF6|nr:hypothetical protein [Rhodococcus aetherivorans]WFS10998.1 hypothetical protein P9K37_14275 [Rhodococcus aetherivorans]